MHINRLFLIVLNISSVCITQAQTDSLNNDEIIDYSKFGDATGVHRYATQKVINQSPTRIFSIGYEYHGGFLMPDVPQDLSAQDPADYSVRRMSGFRAQINLPVVSNDKIIWQLGANYWGSYFNLKETAFSRFEKSLQNNGLHTMGIQTTIFKPLDEKRWLVIQATGDINSSFSQFSELSSKALTISGTAIYG